MTTLDEFLAPEIKTELQAKKRAARDGKSHANATGSVAIVASVAGAAGPLPLFPPLGESEPYPLDKLGPALSRAAKAIGNKAQVPAATAAQSVLAAASLAACAHADVQLPYGQRRPLALFFVTVAASGDRKSIADNEALWPVHKWEKALREAYGEALKEWSIENAAWAAEKRKIEGNPKIDFAERKRHLFALGLEPEKPLSPFLITGDLTVEGLTKNWSNAHAALGVFTAEGGTFTAGHGMNEDNRLKTAAMFSELWDGKPIKRVRAQRERGSIRNRNQMTLQQSTPMARGCY